MFPRVPLYFSHTVFSYNYYYNKSNKKLKFFSRSFSSVYRSSKFFLYIYLNFLFSNSTYNTIYIEKLLKNKKYIAASVNHNLLKGRYSENFLNYFSNKPVFKFRKVSYKVFVYFFNRKNKSFFIKTLPLSLRRNYFFNLLTFLLKFKSFFINNHRNNLIVSFLLLIISTLFFSFFQFLNFSMLLFGSFMTYSSRLYSSINYLYCIFDKSERSKINLDFTAFWHYFFLFNLLQKNFFLLDFNFNKFMFKKFISTLTISDMLLNIKFIQFFIENKYKSLELFWLLPSYKNLLLQLLFFSIGLSGVDQSLKLDLFYSKVHSSKFYFPTTNISPNKVFIEGSNFICYNLFQTYSNFTFLKENTILYSKFFEFYILKLSRLLTKRGLFLKAYSIICFFFFRLHMLNNTSEQFIYFSDPFISILPQLQITQRFIGRNNHRSVVVPRLLHLNKRIPKLLRIFLKNIYNRGEYGLINCFYFEYIDLLNLKAATFKSVTEVYKQSIINLQFIQSMQSSFLFDYKTRINPSSVNARKRVRLRDDLYFF